MNISNHDTNKLKFYFRIIRPDHSVPDHPTPLLMFIKRVNALNPIDSGPIIVHCSAGVSFSLFFSIFNFS